MRQKQNRQSRKIDQVEKDKRIRIVQEWLLDEWPSQDIIAQVKAQWQVEDRQAKRYLADARAAWNEDEDEKVEQKRRRKIQKLQKLIRTMGRVWLGTPAGIRAIVQVEKLIIELEGLKPATKLDITSNGQSISTTVIIENPNSQG